MEPSRERQREGIELAKRAGIYKGRKRLLTPERAAELGRRLGEGGSKAALAREFGLDRTTVSRYIWTGSGETFKAGKGREVTRIAQRVMHCPCGNPQILALGLCSTCYTLKRQGEEYFGGLREAVLERDCYRCRVCDASGRDKRSITVHHWVPGKSVMSLMHSLCPGCHAKVHRTKAALLAM